MFESMTYETILQQALDRVSTDVDKREGSVIMNAVAPASAELSNIYILLDSILQNGYADTAVRKYLILRCKERGITPYPATSAVLKGKFNMEIPIGSRFNLKDLNYTAIKAIENTSDDFYYYQMECETAGALGNTFFGKLSSIDYIDRELEGELVELLIPADDEEDTASLRERYLTSFNTTSYGGNKQDYRDKTNAIDGVGGTVVIPVWNGGGTVKLIIIDSGYSVATDILVSAVQETIDPSSQGIGAGIAPIGHRVTVVTPKEKEITVHCTCTFDAGYTWANVAHGVETALEEYLLGLRKTWEEDEGNLVVRIAQIESRILKLDGILDVTGTTINGVADNLKLTVEELPVFGGVTNG